MNAAHLVGVIRYEPLPLPLSVDGKPRRARFKVVEPDAIRRTEVRLQVRYTRSRYWDSPFGVWVSVGRITHPSAEPGEPGYAAVLADAKAALLAQARGGDWMASSRARRGRVFEVVGP